MASVHVPVATADDMAGPGRKAAPLGAVRRLELRAILVDECLKNAFDVCTDGRGVGRPVRAAGLPSGGQGDEGNRDDEGERRDVAAHGVSPCVRAGGMKLPRPSMTAFVQDLVTPSGRAPRLRVRAGDLTAFDSDCHDHR